MFVHGPFFTAIMPVFPGAARRRGRAGGASSFPSVGLSSRRNMMSRCLVTLRSLR